MPDQEADAAPSHAQLQVHDQAQTAGRRPGHIPDGTATAIRWSLDEHGRRSSSSSAPRTITECGCSRVRPWPTRGSKKAPMQSQSRSQPGAKASSKGARGRPARKQQGPRQEVPKSTAPELWQRIQEDISNWNYECRICTEEVVRDSEVWPCTICWTGISSTPCASKYAKQLATAADTDVATTAAQAKRRRHSELLSRKSSASASTLCPLRLSISASKSAEGLSSAAATLASNSAIAELAKAALKLCGLRSAAAAARRFFNRPSPAEPVNRTAHPSVGDSPLAATRLSTISVILMTLSQAHCGEICGQRLQCGLHTCRKLCHRPGECGDARNGCEQVCGKTKLLCNHTCQNVCHGQTPCNESTACQIKMFVSCPCGNYKKEFRCLASTSNPAPSRPELRCDEECERLDRNRRLAAALNIDPASHTNDHVPFSDNTLKLYKQLSSWGDAQESQFRVFAANPDEVRLRYEPMRNQSRQFLHLLAQDFGFESKSEDYDIHRSVVVWKTDKFVSAPSKTLAQCVKIRAAQAAEAGVAAALRPLSPTPPLESEPFNGIVLAEPRFGLTIDEATTALASDLASLQGFSFKVDFLNDEVLIKATAQYSAFLTPAPVEKSLAALKPRIEQTIRREKLAENALLCHTDSSGAVTRREVLRRPGAGGWSAVAGRAASKPSSSSSTLAPEESAVKPGRKLLGLKKKKPQQPEAGKVWAALDGDVEC
ncbi:hypothetical protein ACJ41O_004450 [Fusarium nematophilum]